MRLYSTTSGVARESVPGELEILDCKYDDLGGLLTADPRLQTVADLPISDRIALDEVVVRAPVPGPGCIYCVGANYESHIEEVASINLDSGESLQETLKAIRLEPMFFTVPSTAVSGPYSDIEPPIFASSMLDYEIEVAAVIGVGGSNILKEDAQAAVAGLTLANDVSARDIQGKAMSGNQFEYGHAKGLDGFKPMGPCLVTMDEFSNLANCELETMVNGEVRQKANLGSLIHDIPTCVSYISRYHTLRPGDVILTGSPAGVGFFQGTFLKEGDLVEMKASGIGTINNLIAAASTAH